MPAKEITATLAKMQNDPKLAARLQAKAQAAAGKDPSSKEMTALLTELGVSPQALATLQPKGQPGAAYGWKTLLTTLSLTSVACTGTTTSTTTTWVHDPGVLRLEDMKDKKS